MDQVFFLMVVAEVGEGEIRECCEVATPHWVYVWTAGRKAAGIWRGCLEAREELFFRFRVKRWRGNCRVKCTRQVEGGFVDDRVKEQLECGGARTGWNAPGGLWSWFWNLHLWKRRKPVVRV